MHEIIILAHNEINAPLILRKHVLCSIPAKLTQMGFNGLEDMLPQLMPPLLIFYRKIVVNVSPRLIYCEYTVWMML